MKGYVQWSAQTVVYSWSELRSANHSASTTVKKKMPNLNLLKVIIIYKNKDNTSNDMSQGMTKPTKWHEHPEKTQISLGIRPVWSESPLCTQWIAKDPSFLHVDSEDWSDWADAQVIWLGRCPGWSESSLCTHAILFCFVMRWLIS